MIIHLIRSIRSRAARLKAAGVFAFAPLLTPDQAYAFAPQDSTHVTRTIPRLPGETQWYAAMVANDRIWYSLSHNQGPIRARNFDGELVFEHIDTLARIGDGTGGSPYVGYRISSDGRVYYFYESASSSRRVAIIEPNGTRIGDFGPAGRIGGHFGGASAFFINDIAVSPVTGRVYVSDEANGSSPEATKKGLVRVFDRDGNFLHEFRSTGVLASTLEGTISHLMVQGDSQGRDEVIVVDTVTYSGSAQSTWKVFGGDGIFRRLATGGVFSQQSNSGILNSAFKWQDRIVFGNDNGVDSRLYVAPSSVAKGSEIIAEFLMSGRGRVIGRNGDGSWLSVVMGNIIGGSSNTQELRCLSYPNFSNFDAVARNAVPNPWVLGIAQRPGGGIVDIDYRVDDSNDETVTTALVGFANGVASLTNVLTLNTLLEGSGSRIGANQPTGTVQRVTWDAGGDWNVDFGTLRVMALARDSRSHWFDTHLVEIPADGSRPAVTISRNPLREEDFLAQCFWLVARKDPSVRLVDGVLFGTSGAEDGVILANGTTTTPAGKAFLLKRDGLRIATTEEITRAREGATPGFTVQLDPPLQMRRTSPSGTFPNKINEFGIESSPSGTAGTNYWYVVRP